ncbi:hypothetical protein [Bacillus sp. 2205SS5-2]|uniref:hypothetical protein n=1 Tax=Bacillus sp. 2205SS5-2 TaxID=3109031 RepID=UPI00300620C6
MKLTRRIGITILIGLILSSCRATLEENIATAEEEVSKVFEAKKEKSNKEGENFNFYTPFGMKVVEESKNNIILEKGSDTFILFYNPNEDKASKVVYEQTKETQSDLIVDDIYQKKGKFGYLMGSNVDEDHVQIIVGVGGAKMTILTSESKMASKSKLMMKIVSSIEYKDE